MLPDAIQRGVHVQSDGEGFDLTEARTINLLTQRRDEQGLDDVEEDGRVRWSVALHDHRHHATSGHCDIRLLAISSQGISSGPVDLASGDVLVSVELSSGAGQSVATILWFNPVATHAWHRVHGHCEGDTVQDNLNVVGGIDCGQKPGAVHGTELKKRAYVGRAASDKSEDILDLSVHEPVDDRVGGRNGRVEADGRRRGRASCGRLGVVSVGSTSKVNLEVGRLLHADPRVRLSHNREVAIVTHGRLSRRGT